MYRYDIHVSAFQFLKCVPSQGDVMHSVIPCALLSATSTVFAVAVYEGLSKFSSGEDYVAELTLVAYLFPLTIFIAVFAAVDAVRRVPRD